jgi:Homocysteine S-methyltransferase
VLALEMRNAASYGAVRAGRGLPDRAACVARRVGGPVERWVAGRNGPTASPRALGKPRLPALSARRAGPTAVMLMPRRSTSSVSLDLISRHWSGRVAVYPESGDFTSPNWVFSNVTPQAFLDETKERVAYGAQTVGGCCGIRPAHMQALKEGLPLRAANPTLGNRSH